MVEWTAKAQALHDDPESAPATRPTCCCARTTRRSARSGMKTGPGRWICWASPASWSSPPPRLATTGWRRWARSNSPSPAPAPTTA
uniref:Uncharacterized protein n=1 Tax=Phenylobacterium glaciei TaxID=2803784 RepID=A0A974P2P4_9CAUL|nr:hypothetical protein JKL49_24385 [Phenylobacterium glaciei]